MGFKIKRFFLLLPALLFLVECSGSKFDELEEPNVLYQVTPCESDIFRIRYTIDKGAPYVQLFNKKGNLVEEKAIAPNARLLMTEVKEDTIQLTYFVSQSDLATFLPWFKTNKYNANRIGNHLIRYDYEISNTYQENKGSEIDSLNIDKKSNMTSLFLKQKLIVKKPTYLFVVSSSKMLLYDPLDKSYTPYLFLNNKSLAKDYLKEILGLYNVEKH